MELLHRDGEDGGLDDIFSGSDEEFGFTEEEIGRQGDIAYNNTHKHSDD